MLLICFIFSSTKYFWKKPRDLWEFLFSRLFLTTSVLQANNFSLHYKYCLFLTQFFTRGNECLSFVFISFNFIAGTIEHVWSTIKAYAHREAQEWAIHGIVLCNWRKDIFMLIQRAAFGGKIFLFFVYFSFFLTWVVILCYVTGE